MNTRDIARLAMPSTKQRAVGLTFGIASDFAMVSLLVLSMWLILRAGEQPPILHLTFAVVGVRALAIGRAVFRYLERLASHNSALTQLATLRSHVFERIIPLVPGALRERKTGDVHASLVDDIDQLQDQPLRVWQPLIVSLVTVGLGILMVALMSPIAALINLVMCVIAVVVCVWLVQRSTATSTSKLPHIRAELVDALIERFEAASVLHAFGATHEADARIRTISQQYVREQQRDAGLTGVTSAVMTFAAGVTTLVTLYLLRPEAGFDIVSAPVFAAAVIVPASLFEVLLQVPQALQSRQLVRESSDRVEVLLGETLPPEIPADTGMLTSAPCGMGGAGDPLVKLTQLSARYPGAATPVIHDINLTLGAGEMLVVTGESGAGKSTLAKVLVRFIDYEGSYQLAGVEARDLTFDAVRRVVGLCEQTPHLFDSDLRQNLKFAAPEADDETLLSVLDRVGLREWAESRGGLDFRVGEHGALVSGGQAGRIALARVLLADFPVVILDEPTAGVDPENAEAMMRDMLGAIPADRAVIVITHTELPSDLTTGGHVRHIAL